ncbi:hypothetical protein JCM8547_008799, partial [Rhodosporidiobolus lusitaniae]
MRLPALTLLLAALTTAPSTLSSPLAFPPSLFSRSLPSLEGDLCASTAQCTAAGYAVPVRAHYACAKVGGEREKKCGWGYAAYGRNCVKAAVSSTSTVVAASSSSSTATSTTTASLAASSTCTATAQCSQSNPSNSHRLCSKGVCGFKCNTKYALNSAGTGCIKVVTASSTSSASASSSSPARTTTTTSSSSRLTTSTRASSASTLSASTSTTTPSGAAPTSTPTSSCTATSQCTGLPLPVNAHALCYKGRCTFRCNSNFALTEDGKGRALNLVGTRYNYGYNDGHDQLIPDELASIIAALFSLDLYLTFHFFRLRPRLLIPSHTSSHLLHPFHFLLILLELLFQPDPNPHLHHHSHPSRGDSHPPHFLRRERFFGSGKVVVCELHGSDGGECQ